MPLDYERGTSSVAWQPKLLYSLGLLKYDSADDERASLDEIMQEINNSFLDDDPTSN